jgi:hypothetical protein
VIIIFKKNCTFFISNNGGCHRTSDYKKSQLSTGTSQKHNGIKTKAINIKFIIPAILLKILVEPSKTLPSSKLNSSKNPSSSNLS